MMGLIGWSVAVPTLLGAALGNLAGQPPSKEVAIPGRWRCWWPACHRLFECLALGRQGRQGHAGANRRMMMNETVILVLAGWRVFCSV
jgi:hypothetical protein